MFNLFLQTAQAPEDWCCAIDFPVAKPLRTTDPRQVHLHISCLGNYSQRQAALSLLPILLIKDKAAQLLPPPIDPNKPSIC